MKTSRILVSLVAIMAVGAAHAAIPTSDWVNDKLSTKQDTLKAGNGVSATEWANKVVAIDTETIATTEALEDVSDRVTQNETAVTNLTTRMQTAEKNINDLDDNKADAADLKALAYKDTVGTAQIDNNAVTSEKVAEGLVVGDTTLTVTRGTNGVYTLDSSKLATKAALESATGDLTNLTGRVAANEGKIGVNEGKIGALEAKVGDDTVANQIAAAITKENLSQYKKAAEYDTETTVADGTYIRAANKVNANLAALDSGIKTVETTLSGQIESATGDLEGLKSRVSTAENTITQHGTDITGLKSADETMQGNISKNAQDITDLKTADTNLNNAITEEAARAKGVEAGLTTSVGAAQKAAEDAQSAADDAQSAADAAQSAAEDAQSAADKAQEDANKANTAIEAASGKKDIESGKVLTSITQTNGKITDVTTVQLKLSDLNMDAGDGEGISVLTWDGSAWKLEKIDRLGSAD